MRRVGEEEERLEKWHCAKERDEEKEQCAGSVNEREGTLRNCWEGRSVGGCLSVRACREEERSKGRERGGDMREWGREKV